MPPFRHGIDHECYPARVTSPAAPAAAALLSTGPSASSAYARIAAVLRDQLAGLRAHTALPSEREIAQQFGVSRMTARQAVGLLESEGRVYRKRPRGTFVSEPRVQFHIGSFTEEVTRMGRSPQADVLTASTQAATREQAQALRLSETTQVHTLTRLRLADGEPLAIENTVIPALVAPDLLAHELTGSIWQLLRDEFDVVPATATVVLESRSLDYASARLLSLREAAPGVVLTRHTVDRRGRYFEYAVDIYRADRAAFTFTADLQRSSSKM